MKEIQLTIDVKTLVVNSIVYKEIFKHEFDWKKKYYFDIFVGSYRFKSEVFTLHETGIFWLTQQTRRD